MKKFYQTLLENIGKYPIAALVVAVLLFYGLYIGGVSVSSWWFERGVEKHEAKREVMKEQVHEHETSAAQSYTTGELNLDRAEESDRKLEGIKKSVKEKRKYAQEQDAKADDAGDRDVDDSELANADICARANALGVRCDPDK
jgi:uncharacterized membrane protein YciS (DUF1049 family)